MTETMASAVFRGPGKGVVIDEIPIPRPREGQVLIRVARCGICGTDVHMTRDHGKTFLSGRRFGHEIAGEIVELGRDAGAHRMGDAVTVIPQMGCGRCAACREGRPIWCTDRPSFRSAGFAHYTLSTAQSAISLPAGLSLADAALTEPFACGRHGIIRAAMTPGVRVAVVGVGGMGLSAIYWARRLGAARVVAVARSDRRREAALAMGAEALLTQHEEIAHDVADLLGGRPDIVFECSGAAGMLRFAVDLVRPRGKVVVLGYCTQPDFFTPSDAVDKEIDLVFSVVYDQADFIACIEALGRGDIATAQLITGTIPLGALPATLEALDAPNRHCKIMVDPWADAPTAGKPPC